MGLSVLTYTLRNGELLHISKVENGAACGCVCPSCHQLLIARNGGTVREHHFAHTGNLLCHGAYETALHLLAEQVFLKAKAIYLPNYYWNYDYKSSHSRFPFPPEFKREIIFETVVLEQAVAKDENEVRPDAIGRINGKEIYIEIANSHFIEKLKHEKLRKLGVACIEVDLAGLLLDEILILERLTTISEWTYWIINPKMDALYRQHAKRIAEQKKLDRQWKEWDEAQRAVQIAMKYHAYKSDPQVKLLLTKNDEVYDCPIRKVLLEPLKSELIYGHPILKQIIDGTYWKPKLYGQWPNGKWFYFKNEMIYIYPAGDRELTEAEKNLGTNYFMDLIRSKKRLKMIQLVIVELAVFQLITSHII